jgi:RNA-binding protein
MQKLTNPEIRKLKARAQLLEATFKVGRAGVTAGFIQNISTAFHKHDLIKVRFDEFKEEKDELSAVLAEKTFSQLIMRVGHVAVFFRALPAKSEPQDAPEGD